MPWHFYNLLKETVNYHPQRKNVLRVKLAPKWLHCKKKKDTEIFDLNAQSTTKKKKEEEVEKEDEEKENMDAVETKADLTSQKKEEEEEEEEEEKKKKKMEDR